MLARIVGNDRHLAWRAWITREADGAESFRIVAEKRRVEAFRHLGLPAAAVDAAPCQASLSRCEATPSSLRRDSASELTFGNHGRPRRRFGDRMAAFSRAEHEQPPLSWLTS